MSPRVLVTGATGFVGRSLVPHLRARGCAVTTLGRAAGGDAAAVVEEISAVHADVVIHLATHFVAEHAVEEIPALVDANVTFGTLVAEGATRSGARLVTIGTAWQHLDGRDYAPVSLYAATKQALDAVTQYYVDVRGLDRRVVVLFDTYGPGDIRPKLVPLLLDAARSGVPLPMSDGHQLIDLTYVEDVAEGIAEAALAMSAPGETVVRSWQPIPVRDLVERVEQAIDRTVPVAWDARPARPREMREDWVFGEPPPGWRARVDLVEGLRRTWEARA